MFVFKEQRHKFTALKFAMWVSEQADSKTADFKSIKQNSYYFPKEIGGLSQSPQLE